MNDANDGNDTNDGNKVRFSTRTMSHCRRNVRNVIE